MAECGIDGEHRDSIELYSLLSHIISDWSFVYHHVKRYPHKARERYYRNESPLQLALKVRERKRNRYGLDEGDEGIGRLQVLQALVDADPASIHSRDKEGRTPLHTACSAGRSSDILQWLIKAEESLRVDDGEVPSVTLRTDFPAGSLPLHLVAASPAFDCISSANETANQSLSQFIDCTTTNIISGYLSTQVIWQAHPGAVWDRDCDGEIPLHSAASWGSLGAVCALLVGAAACEGSTPSSELVRAALTADDRGSTPMDRACERLCSFCVPGREPKTSSSMDHRNSSSFRRSVTREDPFQSSDFAARSLNEGRRSLLRSSQMGSGRQRIPGCGSSFRSSFSSSLVGGALTLGFGEDRVSDELVESPNGPRLRASFISPRRPINPIFGLEKLDQDGDEELAKVEILVKAASGFFEVANIGKLSSMDSRSTLPALPSETITSSRESTGTFRFLHAVIAIGCPPEVVYHVAANHPDQVEELDDRGNSPLILSCKRLATFCLTQASLNPTIETNKSGHDRTSTVSKEAPFSNNEEAMSASDAGRKFVQSLLLGDNCSSVLDIAHPLTQAARPQQQTHPPQLPESKKSTSSAIRSHDLIEHISLSHEIICLLLHSPIFGKPNMASVPDNEGRLPLHILLEAKNRCDISKVGTINELIEVFPGALEVRDRKTGLLPFMVAATPKPSMEDEDSTKELENIYQLLSKAPNALVV